MFVFFIVVLVLRFSQSGKAAKEDYLKITNGTFRNMSALTNETNTETRVFGINGGIPPWEHLFGAKSACFLVHHVAVDPYCWKPVTEVVDAEKEVDLKGTFYFFRDLKGTFYFFSLFEIENFLSWRPWRLGG